MSMIHNEIAKLIVKIEINAKDKNWGTYLEIMC